MLSHGGSVIIQTNRQIERNKKKRITEKWKGGQMDSQTEGREFIQKDGQRDGRSGKEKIRQTDRQTYLHSFSQTNGRTYRQTIITVLCIIDTRNHMCTHNKKNDVLI